MINSVNSVNDLKQVLEEYSISTQMNLVYAKKIFIFIKLDGCRLILGPSFIPLAPQ